ncbi:hypothetical protein EV426DRAFT_706396 [Tirmania nivea]|nr:hypothetical protein EV426DRAFT_706396 [Tirmania nivea]
MPVGKSQPQSPSLHQFRLPTPYSSPVRNSPHLNATASVTPPTTPASSSPGPSSPYQDLTELPPDLEGVVNIIREHFESYQSREQTLVLRVVSKCVAINLCNYYLSPAHFRYTLFLQTNPPTVIIHPMPKAPHSFAENYFSNLVTEMRMAGVLTATEASSRMRTTMDVQLPTRECIPAPGELGPCDIKVADAAFGPTCGRPFPFVVLEAGFRQPYDHPTKKGLLQDARHWLEQSQGEVKCVVLVCIDENKDLIQRPTGSGSEDLEGDHRLEGGHGIECDHDQNMKDDLEEESDEKEEQGVHDEQDLEIGEYESDESDTDGSISARSNDSSGSSIKAYKAHFKRFASSPQHVAEYAGPFTAFIEVWRYDKQQKQMVQSGSRITLLPTPSSPTITLTRRDLGFRPREENNEYHMDLGGLAYVLKGSARQMLAYQRYTDKQKERRKLDKLDREFP